MQKPTIGRIVLFRASCYPWIQDGQEVPAIVTRVWSDTCVNLMVMVDGHETTPKGVTSCCYDADADPKRTSYSWRWPPRDEG